MLDYLTTFWSDMSYSIVLFINKNLTETGLKHLTSLISNMAAIKALCLK